MDYETWLDLCYGIHEIEEPDEVPSYDPYEDEIAEIEHYQNQEHWIEAQIQSWIKQEENQ